MIYLIGLNPALDCYETLPTIELGKKNVVDRQTFVCGGKAVNLALMLKKLKTPSKLLLAAGGFTGDFLVRELKTNEIDFRLFWQKTPTRINFKLKTSEETSFDLKSKVEKETLKEMRHYLEENVTQNDIVVASGVAEEEDYRFLLTHLIGKTVLDVDGKLLRSLLDLKPWLIKPNEEELSACFEPEEPSLDYFLSQGVETVLATFGSSGSLLKRSDQTFMLPALTTTVLTTVGCGDCYLAAFLSYFLKGYSYQEAFFLGAIAASLKASCGDFPEEQQIETCKTLSYSNLRVKTL